MRCKDFELASLVKLLKDQLSSTIIQSVDISGIRCPKLFKLVEVLPEVRQPTMITIKEDLIILSHIIIVLSLIKNIILFDLALNEFVRSVENG